MNVVVLIGGRAGTVQDLPVEHARAMVADGRARWPEGSPHAPPPLPPATPTEGAGEHTAGSTAERVESTADATSGVRVTRAGHQKHGRR